MPNAHRSRRAQLLGNLVLAGTSLVLALLVAEVAFEALDAHKQKRRARQARPFYTWSVHTFAGDPIGSQRGLLKLMLHPLVGTVNVPDMFMDPIHLDARGNAAMAEILAPVLEATLLPSPWHSPSPRTGGDG